MTFRLWCHYEKMPVCDLQTLLQEELSLWTSVNGVIIRRCQSVTFRLFGHYKEMPVCDIQTLVSL